MKNRVHEHYELKIGILNNPFGIEPSQLFTLATRNNPKRRFLFVSKVLGKHLDVDPKTALAAGRLLALRYFESKNENLAYDRHKVIEAVKGTQSHSFTFERGYKLDENVAVLGFAETATALGHSVFSAFEDAGVYYHTTRENYQTVESSLKFEEEHSHATTHYLYEDEDKRLNSYGNVILVDDEISTGNTLLNIIRSIKAKAGNRKFTVLTILDWRSEQSRKKFETFMIEEGVEIEVFSLLEGTLDRVENFDMSQMVLPVTPAYPSTKDNQKKQLPDYRPLLMPSYGKKLDHSIADAGYGSYTGRFGLTGDHNKYLSRQAAEFAKVIQPNVVGKTLVLGLEENMYVPLLIASELKGQLSFRSTTRSPILYFDDVDYPINEAVALKSTYQKEVVNYLYNMKKNAYDTVLIVAEKASDKHALKELYEYICDKCDHAFVYLIEEGRKKIADPDKIGSYPADDVVFLLKEIDGQIREQDNQVREQAIQSGVHYSEMLPIEYKPSKEYLDLYHHAMDSNAKKLAAAVGAVSERIASYHDKDFVLVSLARAGTPAGVLIKRYLEQVVHKKVDHYSVSIIRGKGIDENAIHYILNKHPGKTLQFIDGWTGKGAITNELVDAIDSFESRFGAQKLLCKELAVIADPAHCVRLYGTRDDFLIPNACLNSTVSGLLSRTIHRSDLIGLDDFHGVKFYRELMEEDLSNEFIEQIASHYQDTGLELDRQEFVIDPCEPSWLGVEDVNRIMDDFGIDNVHFVKPGVGETTRVLLRRIPWKILINEKARGIDHIIQLAREKGIAVETYPLKAYNCCGIVKSLKGE
ncbi:MULTISPECIES: phosphoribosyltransferase [unclassified Fusibacter]|uniref:phosphoribosyltransferase n=1 Tax=unclassified Fusibacter TaxID=2624464 RepID=UPI00101165AB|nr:phosphoribosyltransferase [Fusibacter sp. A1]MCK8058242.1 phosphoribosyltransferase [Fusibacter sp. A2]NPE20825.1 hypothetical protein [Fusibacter sp. A1]